MDNNYLKEKVEKFNESTSLTDIQKYFKEAIKIRGFDTETPQDLMLLLTEEIGELAKEVRKTTHIKMDSKVDRTPNFKKELADVFNYVLALAINMDIDLLDAYKEKEIVNCNRDWK